MYTLWKTYDLIYLNGSHRPVKTLKTLRFRGFFTFRKVSVKSPFWAEF